MDKFGEEKSIGNLPFDFNQEAESITIGGRR